MANMSYCRFENTADDLRDCVNTMEEAYDLVDLDLSPSELSNLKFMRTFCEKFLEEADRLLNDDREAEYGDSMDGDHTSALASAGYGTDEDYGACDERF